MLHIYTEKRKLQLRCGPSNWSPPSSFSCCVSSLPRKTKKKPKKSQEILWLLSWICRRIPRNCNLAKLNMISMVGGVLPVKLKLPTIYSSSNFFTLKTVKSSLKGKICLSDAKIEKKQVIPNVSAPRKSITSKKIHQWFEIDILQTLVTTPMSCPCHMSHMSHRHRPSTCPSDDALLRWRSLCPGPRRTQWRTAIGWSERGWRSSPHRLKARWYMVIAG